MEKEGDRSTNITGPVTNSPISSGEFHGPVNYDYSGSPTINIYNISPSEFQSLLQVKKEPDKKFQIQRSSEGDTKNISDQDLDGMYAALKILSGVVKKLEEQITGLRVEQIKTNNELLFSRNELLVKEALIEGMKYADRGRYEDAISRYNTILSLDPNNVLALLNKGIAYSKMGQYEDAIRSYDEALKIDPTCADAWYNKGIEYNNMRRYKDAQSSYDEALKLYSKSKI